MGHWESIDVGALGLKERFALLSGGVIPRPIAFASTVDGKGRVNLSPFSFFNVFSTQPPILVFSPALAGRDAKTKHTYDNVLVCPEVVVNIVGYDIVEQASLASVSYDKGVNEFVKSGLTALPSHKVKPPRVAESPVAYECLVREVKTLGTQGGAGNLVIAEIVWAHVKKSVLDKSGQIDPLKLNPVARLGQDYYCRLSPDTVFEVEKPVGKKSLGVDALPAHLHELGLSNNEMGKLGGLERFPTQEDIQAFQQSHEWQSLGKHSRTDLVHKAKQLLHQNEVEKAALWLFGL